MVIIKLDLFFYAESGNKRLDIDKGRLKNKVGFDEIKFCVGCQQISSKVVQIAFQLPGLLVGTTTLLHCYFHNYRKW